MQIKSENLVEHTGRLYYYDLLRSLRSLLVVLVVIGHGTYYNIVTKFGGIYYADIMKEQNVGQPVFYKLVSLLTGFIYTFHMPVFIALSGSIYALATERTYSSLVFQKAKRLLIPFIVTWFVWNFPIKYLTGYYAGISIYKMLLQLILPAKVYLWYLESLFFIFVIFGLIRKLHANQQTIVVGLFWIIGVLLYQKLVQYHPLGDPLYYLGWFYLGYRVEDIIEILKKKGLWNNLFMVSLFVIHMITFCANRYFLRYGISSVCCKFVILPMFMFIILNYLVRTIQYKSKWLEKAGGYGMGIYLYAEPLNYLILWFFYTKCGITFFGTNVGAAVIYFSRILITPIIAIGITWALKKMNLKYLY